MKNPTLKDVAELAGVSTATVSYIINGSRSVSEKSRQKVEKAIEALSYHPNQLARNFKNGKKNSIGFIVPDIANISFSVIIEEIETILAAKGINLIIANTKETPANEIRQIASLSNGLVDGLIIASTLSDYQQIENLIPEHFPVVLIDRGISNCKADQVLISSETAMCQGISDLAACGHKKIGFIAWLENVYTTNQRIIEYQSALETNGLTFDGSLVKYSAPSISTARLADGLISQGCTAIVAGNDIITMDLVDLSLKQEFSQKKGFHILGYSYGDWYTWLPFLRTISMPTRDVGRLAARRLLECTRNPDTPSKEYVLTCSYHNSRP